MPEIITGQDSTSSYEASGGADEAARVDAARAELYDEAQGVEASDSGELLLGKYKTPEDLANAYRSLQAEYTKLKNGTTAEDAPAVTPDDTPATEEPSEPEAQKGNGIDEAQARALQQRVLEMAGGEDGYQRLANWVANNLPADRVNSWNQALGSGDETQIVTALKGLQYDYMMANGYEPRLTGGRAPSNEVRGYSSEAQVVEAMSDPRYSGDNPDPAYIREVERRLAASNVFQTR